MSNDNMKPERREILDELKPVLKETDLVVAALAGTTADSYQIIDRPGNLYLVGMGMVSQVALGLATALPNCRIFALDTDGSMLLAPSILPVIGTRQPKNLYILVFDNEQLFGSRGGPASQTATGTDIAGIAKASGLENVRTLSDKSSSAPRLRLSCPVKDRRCSSPRFKPLAEAQDRKWTDKRTNTDSSGMLSALQKLKFSVAQNHNSDVHRTSRSRINNRLMILTETGSRWKENLG